MSVVLDPAVQAQLDKGDFHILPLVKFEIPGHVLGYYVGMRPFTYNGFTYQPNRLLDLEDLVETLDIDLGERTLKFSDIPVVGDAISDIEALEYTGAPVTVSRLVVDPKLGVPEGVKGVLDSTFHKISHVVHGIGAIDDNGQSTLTLSVVLKSPGVAGRESTQTVRSDAEHKFDNNPNDTFYKDVATGGTVVLEWGTRSG